MPEQLTLATPVSYATPDLTAYTVAMIVLDWRTQHLQIELRGTNNEVLLVDYNGEVAITLMKALNTANLTTKSLHRRVLERVLADGRLAGTIAGSAA